MGTQYFVALLLIYLLFLVVDNRNNSQKTEQTQHLKVK